LTTAIPSASSSDTEQVFPSPYGTQKSQTSLDAWSGFDYPVEMAAWQTPNAGENTAFRIDFK
jgi:hypothetical protein